MRRGDSFPKSYMIRLTYNLNITLPFSNDAEVNAKIIACANPRVIQNYLRWNMHPVRLTKCMYKMSQEIVEREKKLNNFVAYLWHASPHCRNRLFHVMEWTVLVKKFLRRRSIWACFPISKITLNLYDFLRFSLDLFTHRLSNILLPWTSLFSTECSSRQHSTKNDSSIH